MDEIDKLLADLQAQQKPPIEPKATHSPALSSRSMDELLKQIDGRLSQSTTPQEPSHPARSSEPISESTSEPSTQKFSSHFSSHARSREDNLLEQVKSQYENHDRVVAEQQAKELHQAELQRQQQAQAKQQRLERLKAKRRAELAEQAKKWLKRVNPKSAEGRWFEEFACGYESRLEAAIDYLEALQEVDPSRYKDD